MISLLLNTCPWLCLGLCNSNDIHTLGYNYNMIVIKVTVILEYIDICMCI